MDRELKLFSAQIETWGSPLSIRAFDANNAEGLTRILFKIPSDVGITVTAEKEALERQGGQDGQERDEYHQLEIW